MDVVKAQLEVDIGREGGAVVQAGRESFRGGRDMIVQGVDVVVKTRNPRLVLNDNAGEVEHGGRDGGDGLGEPVEVLDKAHGSRDESEEACALGLGVLFQTSDGLIDPFRTISDFLEGARDAL